jgi:hypothetical protein
MANAAARIDLPKSKTKTCAFGYPSYRGHAHRSAEIGGSEGKVALASKTPVDAAGTGDAAYLPAKFALKGRYPGYKLEAQAIVDHREAA